MCGSCSNFDCKEIGTRNQTLPLRWITRTVAHHYTDIDWLEHAYIFEIPDQRVGTARASFIKIWETLNRSSIKIWILASYIAPSTSFRHITLPATCKLFRQVTQQSQQSWRRKVHKRLENWHVADGNTKIFLIVKKLSTDCKELLERNSAHIPKVT